MCRLCNATQHRHLSYRRVPQPARPGRQGQTAAVRAASTARIRALGYASSCPNPAGPARLRTRTQSGRAGGAAPFLILCCPSRVFRESRTPPSYIINKRERLVYHCTTSFRIFWKASGLTSQKFQCLPDVPGQAASPSSNIAHQTSKYWLL